MELVHRTSQQGRRSRVYGLLKLVEACIAVYYIQRVAILIGTYSFPLHPCLVSFNQFIDDIFLYFFWMRGWLIRVNFYPEFLIFRLMCEDSIRLLCVVLLRHRGYQHDAVLAVVKFISDDYLVPVTLKRLLGFRYQKCIIGFELEKDVITCRGKT